MKKTKKILLGILLALISLISLVPFWLMFSMSTYKSEQIFQNNPLIPSNYLMENIHTIFESNFVQSYANSFIISIVAMVLSVVICSMVGYAMNVYEFKGKKILNLFIMMTMMVPTQIGIIGYMIEMRNVRLNNTLLPMIFV